MTVIAIAGSAGFIGSACYEVLQREGSHELRRLASPRLSTTARTPRHLRSEAENRRELSNLLDEIAGCDVVINAAGLPNATGQDEDALYGANALLPALLSVAAEKVEVRRLIHVSSAAVQGTTEELDESNRLQPFSPYSRSKGIGELVLPSSNRTVILRPTSVHGARRHLTRQLSRVARSGLACVAGSGDNPSPQVHVDNVAGAVSYLSRLDREPPRVVLQPSEMWTTASFLAMLGGREPRHISERFASGTVALTRYLSLTSGRPAAHVRRLEMLLFGQPQCSSWLDGQADYFAVASREDWRRLADGLKRSH